MLLSDQYDELSLREQDAARALKSALVGLFILPLQLYTAWLVLMVILAEESLRPRYFWYAVGAAIIAGIDVPFSTLLILFLFG